MGERGAQGPSLLILTFLLSFHSDPSLEYHPITNSNQLGLIGTFSLSDMQKFGLFPETDCFCTVVCSECNALVKPQGLLNHMRKEEFCQVHIVSTM